ncbi:hypothetical protein GCM10028805_60230 [Spirosoma harenae]
MDKPDLSPTEKVEWAKVHLRQAMDAQATNPSAFNKGEEDYWRVLYNGYVEELRDLQQRLYTILRQNGQIKD